MKTRGQGSVRQKDVAERVNDHQRWQVLSSNEIGRWMSHRVTQSINLISI